jgi:hypothetical protein
VIALRLIVCHASVMVRPLRIQFPGVLYHVISRGNQRGPVALDGADRRKRLDWLRLGGLRC